MERPRILVAVVQAQQRNTLKQLLTRGGYQLIAEAEEGLQALRYARSFSPDLVIAETNLRGINGIELGRVLFEDRIAPLLLIVTGALLSTLGDPAQETYPFSYVIKPVTEDNLFPAIASSISYYKYIRKLESQVKTLHEKIETRKLTEKAKGILMEQMNISEAEAYRILQKQSMDRCLPLRKIAEAVIINNDLKNIPGKKDNIK